MQNHANHLHLMPELQFHFWTLGGAMYIAHIALDVTLTVQHYADCGSVLLLTVGL